MRTIPRLLTGTALTAVALGAFAAPAAYAGDIAVLEVYPATATPGETVTVNTTACGKNGSGLGDTGTLGAGEFKVAPGTHKEVVIGQFKVPAHAKPGAYDITVTCVNGKTAAGALTVTHGGGGKVPGGHQKGEGHEEGVGSHVPVPNPSGHVPNPSGHVKTGVGGSVGPDTAQIAAGAAVLAAAAVGGVWLLRRRASGAQGR
ncbi:hypothetical protein [Streptomyces sp. NPDC006368]|uniref:hypothetical protein n=1 Tax=Streptomyces sp. NPDC006368 TaxID=3156760 RepID=UPI0033AFA794